MEGFVTEKGKPNRRSHRRHGPTEWFQDLVYGIIRWTGRHVRGLYAALGVYLLISLGIVLAALGLFAALAEIVFGGAIEAADRSAVIWARGLESDFLDVLALIGVALGSGAAAWIVIGVGSVVLWRTRHHLSVLLLWVAIGGARILNQTLKAWYGRPRPDLVPGDLEILGREFAFPGSPSFPSGHALTSTVIFLTVAYLIARIETTRRVRQVTFAVAVAAVLLVAASRVYLAVHYPSDVVAGIVAGMLWSTFAALGIEVIRYFWRREPEVVRSEADLEKGVEPLREALRPSSS